MSVDLRFRFFGASLGLSSTTSVSVSAASAALRPGRPLLGAGSGAAEEAGSAAFFAGRPRPLPRPVSCSGFGSARVSTCAVSFTSSAPLSFLGGRPCRPAGAGAVADFAAVETAFAGRPGFFLVGNSTSGSAALMVPRLERVADAVSFSSGGAPRRERGVAASAAGCAVAAAALRFLGGIAAGTYAFLCRGGIAFDSSRGGAMSWSN
ncbi:hypothetical protein BKA80DRAFT_270682 [Phyllosticta citrichinensis]